MLLLFCYSEKDDVPGIIITIYYILYYTYYMSIYLSYWHNKQVIIIEILNIMLLIIIYK